MPRCLSYVVRAVADVVDAEVFVVPVAAVEEAVVGDVGREDAVAAGHRLAEGGDVGFVHFAVAVEVGVVAALRRSAGDIKPGEIEKRRVQPRHQGVEHVAAHEVLAVAIHDAMLLHQVQVLRENFAWRRGVVSDERHDHLVAINLRRGHAVLEQEALEPLFAEFVPFGINVVRRIKPWLLVAVVLHNRVEDGSLDEDWMKLCRCAREKDLADGR